MEFLSYVDFRQTHIMLLTDPNGELLITEQNVDNICSKSMVILWNQEIASMVSACRYFPGKLFIAGRNNSHISFEGLQVVGSIDYAFYSPQIPLRGPFGGISSSTLRVHSKQFKGCQCRQCQYTTSFEIFSIEMDTRAKPQKHFLSVDNRLSGDDRSRPC